MGHLAFPLDEPLELRRKIPLAALGVLCALVAYLWILSSGLFHLSPDLLPLETIAALAALLTMLDPRLGVGLMVFAIGVSPEFELLGIPNVRMEDFLFPVLLASWFLRSAARREAFSPTELKSPLLLILLLSVLSSLYNSVYADLDLERCGFRLAKSLEYCLIFSIALNTFRREEDLRRIAFLMPLVGVLVGIYGLFQSFQGPGKVTGPSGETANIIGAYYVFHICLALGLLSYPVKHRVPLALGVVVMLVPLLNTMARASYVALFAGLLVMGIVRRSRAIWLVVLVGAIGLLASTETAGRLLSILKVFQGDVPSSLEARMAGWSLFISTLYQAPVLGHGIGNVPLGAFDNEFVRQVYELGLLGILLLTWVLAAVVRSSYRISRVATDPTLAGFAFGLLGGTVAFLVHSLAATTFTAIRTAEPFFAAVGILGAIACHARKAASEEDMPSELPAMARLET